MPRTTAFFAQRVLLAVASTVLVLGSPALAVTDFSGNWVLDLRSSSSPEAILKRLGASWVERQFGGKLQLDAIYSQTPQSLTVQLKGVGFQRTDVLPINNKTQTLQDPIMGNYTIRTFWSGNGTQLLSAVALHTKDAKDGQITIVRQLSDDGKTLTLSGTLKVSGESGSWTLRRIWRKRD